MIPVILSGGSGTRLWPLSRPMYPKQFLPLISEYTMFQDTYLRVRGCAGAPPIVVANAHHRFMAAENLRQLGVERFDILLEETGRNTAPAIAAAAFKAIERGGGDAVMIVLPADHVIQDIEAFEAACGAAEELAKKGYMVTFGITPKSAHTGYGYIETGDRIESGQDAQGVPAAETYTLNAFQEKPDQHTAERYIESGRYVWNSGMFVFKASVYLEELRAFEPEMVALALAAVENGREDLDFLRLDDAAFSQCKSISIDYAVMEKTDKGAVVSLDADWSDVGAWDALWEAQDKDERGNVVKGDAIVMHSRNNFIYGENKLVSVLGLENMVVVDTKDALLVAHKDYTQDVKAIVDALKKGGRSEGQHHRTVYRPWGHYDAIDRGERDQVKRITVMPGQKLSLQKHEHRAEHWVVVKGRARVTKGEEEFTVDENESVYLPIGIVHALANAEDSPLELIEVQTGNYLGEDDIIRLEDLYGRS